MVAIRYPLPPLIKTQNTEDYIRVLREADTQGRGYFPGPDGALDRNELSGYTGMLNQQKQFMEMFNNFFTQFFGYSPFGQQIADINKKLEIAGNMQNNFNQFDNGRYSDGQITQNDLYGVAGRDGNYGDITGNDINGSRPLPYPIPNQADRNLVDKVSQDFTTLDKDRNGFLDRNELRSVQTNLLERGSLNSLNANRESLMFGNIEAGSDAWFGISQADLGNLKQRLANGQSIEEAAASIRQERGYNDKAAFEKMVDTNQDRVAYNELSARYGAIDADGNGSISRSELNKAAGGSLSRFDESLYRIAQNEHTLMFASIDPGNAAWHGLTRADLAALQTRATNGQTVAETETALRQQISRQRGYPSSYSDFLQHILQTRRNIPQR